jgi:peptidoglycan-associated lipoprotein
VLAKAVVYFANDSYKLSHEAQETINTVADFLNKYDDIQVSLVGSANKTGTAKHNQWLSENRVNAVKNALLEKGVPLSKIDGTSAVGDNGMTKAPECRRVVFTLE